MTQGTSNTDQPGGLPVECLRVLVADDEPGMRHGIVRALSTFVARLPEVDAEVSMAVEAVSSGEEALTCCEKNPPDILLLDHKMGGMTGLEVLDQLRKRGRDVLTIMITAFATIETAVRATKCGAFDFIAKPFTPEELRETVRKVAAHLLLQRRAARLLEEKKRVRFEFIRVLGHELKAPLAAIENYLNLMQAGALGERIEGYERVIRRCLFRCEGMRKLIADLLDMTRIESGEKKRDLVEVDLVEAARNCLEGAAVTAAQRQVELRLDAPASLPMIADRTEIDIVLNNLVSNAIKYNRDGGRVAVRLQGDDDRVTFSVEDTGIGLTPAESSRLFQDFVRIRNEKTQEISGSGLGLSVVKKIAELYGGSVAVKSEADVGSTFSVELKRRAARIEASASLAAPGATAVPVG